MNSRPRSINWYETSLRALEARHPEIRSCSDTIVERLVALLLQRLPRDTAARLLDVLPEFCPTRSIPSLQVCAQGDSELSIGYPDFVGEALLSGIDEEEARRVADTFLWSVAQELSPELKIELGGVLPAELRHRMNLLTSTSEEARVA